VRQLGGLAWLVLRAIGAPMPLAVFSVPSSLRRILMRCCARGGIAFGLLGGHFVYLLLRSVDYYHVELQLTGAGVMGGFVFANAVGISGPPAMVAAGHLIGKQGKDLPMSEETIRNLDMFRELLEEFLTCFLFV